jgi:superfamily II helicase
MWRVKTIIKTRGADALTRHAAGVAISNCFITLKSGDNIMENATEEMRELRIAAQRYEWNNEFSKADLIRQLYVELYRRFNGLPVGEYWDLF